MHRYHFGIQDTCPSMPSLPWACLDILTLWCNSLGFFESSKSFPMNLVPSLTTLEHNCNLPIIDNTSFLVAYDFLPQSDKNSHISHTRSSDILSCFKLKSMTIPKTLKNAGSHDWFWFSIMFFIACFNSCWSHNVICGKCCRLRARNTNEIIQIVRSGFMTDCRLSAIWPNKQKVDVKLKESLAWLNNSKLWWGLCQENPYRCLSSFLTSQDI